VAIVNGFIEERLTDPCPAYTFASGTSASTRVVTLANGHEKRNGNWSGFKMVFTCPFMNITTQMAQVLKGAFYVARGRLYGFRFKDWADYRATNEPLGISPAGSTPVQLVKTYEFGAESYTRPIRKPVAGTVTVRANGTTPIPGTLDMTTGLFTPTSAWPGGAVLTWTGEFDIPVRFDTDVLTLTIDNVNALNGDVQLVEIFT
jgi:uncharacterized protein (TIGR02217 family)